MADDEIRECRHSVKGRCCTDVTAAPGIQVTWRSRISRHGGPIVIKSAPHRRARRAGVGAKALVVSTTAAVNSTIAPTLRICLKASVGDQIEVLLDGGIRRGSDIVKALCLGARAVMVGRAYAYGLGAAGGAGVARAIEILRADLIRTLKLLGCPSVAELDQS